MPSAAAVAALLVLPGMTASGQPSASSSKPTIVLEHGAWADGSSWEGVVHRLQKQGFTVLVPPDPLRGPVAGGDSAYLASYLAKIPGPIVLVGHSYGGMVITDAAVGNPNVKALVYVDAYIPDEGNRSAPLPPGRVSASTPPRASSRYPSPAVSTSTSRSAPNPPYVGFDQCFANGVPPAEAAVLAVSQRPLSAAALADPSGPPAWKTIPSWSLIGTQDRVIPPAQQHAMSSHANAHIETFNAGHLGLITRPGAVVRIIDDAVNATS